MLTQPDPHLNQLCLTHWQRLYGIARRSGLAEQDLQDLVQDVFVRLLRRDQLRSLATLPSPAHQAAFLTIRLQREINHHWRARRALRRGGLTTMVPLTDDHVSEEEPAHHQTPEWSVTQAWLQELLDRAFARLREEMSTSTWQRLYPLLRDPEKSGGPQNGATRTALHRARQRLRTLLTLQVQDTHDSTAAVQQLFNALTPALPY